MALSKTAQAPVASQSLLAGAADVVSVSQSVNYGVSVEASIANGGTGPTVGCDVYLQVDAGANGFVELGGSRQTAGLTANTTYRFRYDLGVGEGGGNWPNYKIGFGGNTGQAVTIQADGSTTTAL
jgi:hypothetical protein